MRVNQIFACVTVLMATACVDRLDIDISKSPSESFSLFGYISDQPGPYEIRISNVFDIESKESMRIPISVKKLELSDNFGVSEEMTEVNPGVYQTNPSGIRGVVGGVYKVKVEFYDGRVYESLPDTILSPGSLDSMYFNFNTISDNIGNKSFTCDVFFNASYNSEINNRFLWKAIATFKGETQPEQNNSQCFYLEEIGRCNFAPPCSGYVNVGTTRFPRYEKKHPCTCCTCWYNILNENLLLSDKLFTRVGKLNNVQAQSIVLNNWMLYKKLRISVSQLSLTENSYRFYKAIKDQKEAIGSLFQPVTGKIPSNFLQLEGESAPIEGLFFATAISSKETYITKLDLPIDIVFEIKLDTPRFGDDCRLLFPSNTTTKPSFWID